MTVFATVMAFTKDLPDIKGDIKYGVTTSAFKFGMKAVSQFATLLLLLTYVLAMALLFIAKARTHKAIPLTLSIGLFLACYQ